MNVAFSTRKAGITCGLLSGLCFATLNVMIKSKRTTLDPLEFMFARGIAGVVFIFPFAKNTLHYLLKWRNYSLWVRFFSGFATILAIFYNIQISGASVAMSLSNLSAIFIVILSSFYLREKLSTVEWIGLVITIFGVFLLRSPWGLVISPLSLGIGVFGALAGSISMISLRMAATRYPSSTIVWGFSFFSCLLSFVFLKSHWKDLNAEAYIALFLTAILGVVGQVLLTRTYMYLPATLANAITVSSVGLSIVIESVYFCKMPSILSMISCTCMTIGVLLIQKNL